MHMTTFTVCLGNPRGYKYGWNELCTEIRILFKQVIEFNRTFTDVRVYSTMSRPGDLLPHDVLIYVMGGHADSVIRGRFEETSLTSDQYGLTGWDNGEPRETGAEIFIRHKSPKFLARMAFHEALHYKTHSGENLHSHLSRGLAQKEIDEETPLTKGNKHLMSSVLRTHRNPYFDGFDLKPHSPISFD
jgi:hypothetical protein